MEKVSAFQAVKLLGISIDNLKILEKQGIIHPTQNTKGVSFYSSSEIERIKSRHGLTLEEEAARIDSEIQHEIVSSVSRTKKVLIFAGGALSGYILLVAVLTILFIINPLQTAVWLGYIQKTQENIFSKAESTKSKVLAAATSTVTENPLATPLQAILQPMGRVSLGLVKFARPDAYAQVAKVTILDTNDVLGLDTSGRIIPERPINLPESSLLQVGNNGLVVNLNSEYLQGRQPGTNPGDIAIVGTTISGLTNANFSGSAGITNANLANSSVTISTGTGLLGGAVVTLGESVTLTNSGVVSLTGTTNQISVSGTTGNITLSLPQNVGTGSSPSFAALNISNTSNQLILGTTNVGTLSWSPSTSRTLTLPDATDTLIGKTTTDVLTNKTISAGGNTISGLTNANFSGSAGITNANLANSSVTITTGNGLSGGGVVSLGGSISLTNTGVLSLTGTTNQVDVSSSTGDITLTLPQNIHTGASPTFAGLTLSGLINCGALATDASGVTVCDGATGDTASFTDTTPATIADNDTTELFNDTTKPSIAPNIATQTILVTVHARFTGSGGVDTYPAMRIVRNNGSAASCSTSAQVGDIFSTFMTTPDTVSATGTFLDSPATTGQVFYTVCSSASSNLGGVPVSNRIDVTLVKLGS